MKFAFKFKLPKWEKPKPEVPYVSNPMIEELEKLDFVALTAERRHDVLLRIKHSAAAVAEDRRRNPAILTDRIRLQRLWVNYFKINQTTPPGEDAGESLSFALSDQTGDLSHQKRAPGALMSTQEELVAQANFKIDMGDMTMDDMDDFDTPPPRLPPRPLPASINHDFSQVTEKVLEVKHPETGDSLKIAGLDDLVIAPPEATVAALSAKDHLPQPVAAAAAETQSAAGPDPLITIHDANEMPKLSADEQTELVARMRARAQEEAAAQTEVSIADNPMLARMRALAASKAAAQSVDQAPEDADASQATAASPDPERDANDAALRIDLATLDYAAPPPPASPDEVQTNTPPAPMPDQPPVPQPPEEEPRLSAEEQIRLTEDMRARIKAEAVSQDPITDDPMLARMRKLAQKAQEIPAPPAALTISIPEDPVEPETLPPTVGEETFEQIKSQIVADTLQQAQSAHLQDQGSPQSPAATEPKAAAAPTEDTAFEAGMLERLRRLAGLSAPAKQPPAPVLPAETKASPPAPEAPSAPPIPSPPEPAPAQAVEPVAVLPEPKPEPPKPPPREREASATPSTRDWVNVKLLRPTVIRGLPLPDQVITIVPYPDAKRLEENGSVQILTKPRAPRSS